MKLSVVIPVLNQHRLFRAVYDQLRKVTDTLKDDVEFVIIDNAKGCQSVLVNIRSFRNWLFHPSILRYSNPKGKAVIFRYPTPGNFPLESAFPEKVSDYKTPYEHTKYNVRYTNPTPMQTSNKFSTFIIGFKRLHSAARNKK